MTEKTIIEMLRNLDPHSVYISAKDVKDMNEPLNGNFEGIGIQFNLLRDTIIVIEPLSGGPSEKVGLLAGDRIIVIDGEKVAGIGISTSGVRSKLMGMKGTKVNLNVFRKGEKEILDFTIVRDKIPIFSLDAAYMLDKETGYVKLNKFAATTFIDNVYIPDVVAVASLYPDYFKIGKGVGNFISYGGLPTDDNGKMHYDSGTYIDGNIGAFDSNLIAEFVKYSKYSSGSGLYPLNGETTPDAKKDGAYSWLKAPRYNGKVVEVGPLARAIITYLKGSDSDYKSLIDSALSTLGLQPADLISVMGRHAARALELSILTDRMDEWVDELDPSAPVMAKFKIPKTSEGMGLTEAARGSLGHWISIDNFRIENYQAVVPTTWNGGPRDDAGNMGPYEQALIGAPIADVENPIEVGRVIRSFDPCLACAVHIVEGDREILKFRVC